MLELTTQLSTGGRRTKFTPEKVQQIKNLVERGQNREEIAELIGMTIGSLQVACSRLGISLRRPIFDTGTGLLRRGRPRSNNGKATHNPSRSGRVPLQPTKEQPQQNSQSGPVEQAQAATPHQDRARTNEAGLAKFAIKMQYRRHERTTELPQGLAGRSVTLLRNHPVFRALAPPVIERLASSMKHRRVARGGIIFAKGDAGTGLMGVLAGSVKISAASEGGRDIVLNIIHPGEIFGEIALLDGHPRAADATAMTDCELVVIEHRDFMPFVRGEAELGLQFIEMLCGRLRRTSEQVEDVTFLDLPTSLAKTLLGLSEAPAPTGKVAITQDEISQIIGRSRGGTNKQLRAWAKHGWIRLERGHVSVLRSEKLAEIAAEGFEQRRQDVAEVRASRRNGDMGHS